MSFSKEELDHFVDQSFSLMAVLDEDGIVLKANSLWAEEFSMPLEDIVGKSIFNLVQKEERKNAKAIFSKLVVKHKATTYNFKMVDFHQKLLSFNVKLSFKNNLVYFIGYDNTEAAVEHTVLEKMSQITKTGAWQYNAITKLSTFTDQGYRILEYPKETPIHLETIINFLTEEYRDDFRTALTNLIEHHKPYDFQGEICTVLGHRKWIRAIGKPVVHNGNLIQVNGTFSDITREHKFIENLKYNRETMELALKGIRSGVFDHHIDKDQIYYSKAFRKMVGLPIDTDFVSETLFRQAIHPDDREEAYGKHVEGLLKEGNHYFNHYRLKDNSKEYKHYEVYAWRKKDIHGKTTRMIGNLIDVNDKVLHEQERILAFRRLKAIVNNGFVHTVLLSPERHILIADNAALDMIDDDIDINFRDKKVDILDVIPPFFKKQFHNSFTAALEGHTIRKEVERKFDSKFSQWFEVIYKPIYDEYGTIKSVLLNFFDLTQRKLAEIAAREAQSQAEELSRLKSNILYNVNHEIRTPLNGIIGITQLLEEELDGNANDELLGMLRQSNGRLLETLDNLMRTHGLSSMRNQMKAERVNLNDLVFKSFERFKNQVFTKRLNYLIRLPENEMNGMLDPKMFSIALDNIISNAIKYTEKGTVTVRLFEDSNADEYVVSVKDTGIGIKAENLSKIFDFFIQESLGMERDYEGSGLGLGISKNYIEFIGGALDVRSMVGKGSEFLIRLPIK